jgi:phage host-nuclease inhibitor protein Gam
METLTYTDETISPETTMVIDGMIVDVATGEVVGVDAPEDFYVHDEDSFNWVMSKMLDADSRVASILTSPEVVRAKAIIANAERITKDAQNRKTWFETRFGHELARYAKAQMDGGKSKTFKTVLGAISFRTKKGGLRVEDKEKALETAQFNGWTNAIKYTEEFQISKLDPAQKELAEAKLLPGFTVEPDSETFTITTGVTA